MPYFETLNQSLWSPPLTLKFIFFRNLGGFIGCQWFWIYWWEETTTKTIFSWFCHFVKFMFSPIARYLKFLNEHHGIQDVGKESIRNNYLFDTWIIQILTYWMNLNYRYFIWVSTVETRKTKIIFCVATRTGFSRPFMCFNFKDVNDKMERVRSLPWNPIQRGSHLAARIRSWSLLSEPKWLDDEIFVWTRINSIQQIFRKNQA